MRVESLPIFYRSQAVHYPRAALNVLAMKSAYGPLPYYKTGAELEGLNQVIPFVSGFVHGKYTTVSLPHLCFFASHNA